MIIDVNAALGHYPFRRLHGNTADSMLPLMDRYGIDRAVVVSLNSVFYRDAHQGNAELFEETHRNAERFVPVATANPKYVGWQQDLDEAVDRWGMKAVALFPEHHGYQLSDEFGRAALTRIAQLELPVVLTQRLEDRRQRHHWDVAEDLTAKSLYEVAAAHPQLRFLLSNWIGLDGAKLVAAGLEGRCLIDFARLHVTFQKDVPKLIDALGIQSIAFGSHMPFDYLGGSLVKLANCEGYPREDFERIAWKNAADFLRLN